MTTLAKALKLSYETGVSDATHTFEYVEDYVAGLDYMYTHWPVPPKNPDLMRFLAGFTAQAFGVDLSRFA